MKPQTTPLPEELTPYPVRGVTVLLIDDQAMVAEAVRRTLASEEDIAFHYCGESENAIYQAIAHQPTVILLDLVMPGEGGIGLTRMFRAHPATASVPIIILSTKEDPQVKSDAFSAGADDYLIKLPDRIELVARIRSHSDAYLTRLYHDAVLEDLRAGQQRLIESNAALQALNEEVRKAHDDAEAARLEAERANRAKSEFFSRMSHELRTPLNAILGFAQLLELAELPREHQKSVQYILQGGRYLLELVNEVLDIARIETGRLELSLEPVAVNPIIDASLTLVRPQAERKHIRIDVRPVPGDYFVMADRQRLAQVLLNLFSNAVKYNSEHGALSVWCDVPAPGRMRICVRDTGPGLAPDKLANLFVPFERLGAERSGVEGTGLGLALAKTLAEAMGGSIEVESETGQGSVFAIELEETVHPMNKSDLGPQADSADLAALTEAPEKTGTVLYIEDNNANFDLIEAVLNRRPTIGLLKAIEGKVGLEMARTLRPDLILLDLHLPDMNGHDVLRALQLDKVTEDIPVIVVSADATTDKRDKLLSAGARCYLTKPLVIQRLIDAIDQALADVTQSRQVKHKD